MACRSDRLWRDRDDSAWRRELTKITTGRERWHGWSLLTRCQLV